MRRRGILLAPGAFCKDPKDPRSVTSSSTGPFLVFEFEAGGTEKQAIVEVLGATSRIGLVSPKDTDWFGLGLRERSDGRGENGGARLGEVLVLVQKRRVMVSMAVAILKTSPRHKELDWFLLELHVKPITRIRITIRITKLGVRR